MMEKRERAQRILDQNRREAKKREIDALRDYKKRIKELRYGPEEKESSPLSLQQNQAQNSGKLFEKIENNTEEKS